ncbi:phosphoribosylformylglycinamidine synthase subunit PurS [Bacillus marinisedimentorum]|uniref:phosphoribosylformylglycinamidine synthase subunit PurS n=1 Tax=Bacillus marinisedimentorum TaxID=1821260 RepID=UPI00087344C4|nr:phosphoribosylformylglycinamidine synthase subunit PurS [Bacillus marinisedimentorum]
MYKVKVYVTLKQGVLDPQGKAVNNSLHKLGYDEVEDVRIGKYMELTVNDTANIEERIEEMCDKLLANPVIEDYRYEIEEVVSQ